MNDRKGARVSLEIYDELSGSDGVLPEQSPQIFMAARGIDEGELRARLTEFRHAETWESPWEMDTIDVLTTEFLNWDRWER